MDKKGLEYIKADSFNIKDIPSRYLPTQRTFYFLGVFLLISIFISLFNVPLGKMMSGQTDFAIELGFPMTMISFDMENPVALPFKVGGIIVDVLLALILGLAMDLIISISAWETKRVLEESGDWPKLYKK